MIKRVKKVLPAVYDESLSYYEVLCKLSKRVNEVAEELEVILPDIQDIEHLLESKQDTLVSGENIKTVNNNSLLGAGNVDVQEPLVSGVNIKTINDYSLLGSGNINIGGGGGGTDDYTQLNNLPQINSHTLTGDKSSGDLGLQEQLISGTNIKTINNESILGSGNISVGGGSGGVDHLYIHNIVITSTDLYRINFEIVSTSGTAITSSTLPTALGTTSGTRIRCIANGVYVDSAHNETDIVSYIQGDTASTFSIYFTTITTNGTYDVSDEDLNYSTISSLNDKVITLW